jgi:hypothetical protein
LEAGWSRSRQTFSIKVEKGGVSHGIYAPDIKYNKHNDTFYMITTQIAGGVGNMVVKTKDPAKGWSEVQKLILTELILLFSLMMTEKLTSFTTMLHQKEPSSIKVTALSKCGITIWKKTRLLQVQTELL